MNGRWEASGIGDRSRRCKADIEDADCKKNEREVIIVGEDDRKDFFHSESSLVLYMWQVFHEYKW